MAPVDKSADGSDPADKTATEVPSSATGDKSVGGTAVQGLDQSGKQGTPVLQDVSGLAESTMTPKLESTQVLSEYNVNGTDRLFSYSCNRGTPFIDRFLIHKTVYDLVATHTRFPRHK